MEELTLFLTPFCDPFLVAPAFWTNENYTRIAEFFLDRL